MLRPTECMASDAGCGSARIGPERQQEVRRSEVIEAENATPPLPEGAPIGAASEANWREMKAVADREGFDA